MDPVLRDKFERAGIVVRQIEVNEIGDEIDLALRMSPGPVRHPNVARVCRLLATNGTSLSEAKKAVEAAMYFGRGDIHLEKVADIDALVAEMSDLGFAATPGETSSIPGDEPSNPAGPT